MSRSGVATMSETECRIRSYSQVNKGRNFLLITHDSGTLTRLVRGNREYGESTLLNYLRQHFGNRYYKKELVRKCTV